MMAAHNPPNHIVYHGGNMDTIDMERELGWRAAFDLFHRDDIVFCYCGLAGVCWFCARGELPL